MGGGKELRNHPSCHEWYNLSSRTTVSMGIENGTLLGIENGTLLGIENGTLRQVLEVGTRHPGSRGGSGATGAGAAAAAKTPS